MPWFFSIPEFLKKRACRYLLQHYLGQFLEEKISLDDLTVDLYNGTGSIHNIPLNVQAINDTLGGAGIPLRVVSGFIQRVTMSVPWAALLKESCVVELVGLTICVAPHHLLKLEEYMSMTDSLFFSMTSSRQMAEEVLRAGAGEVGGEQTPGFEGMETLAQAIELVLARVQITLTDTVFQVHHEPPDAIQPTRHFLQLRIKKMEYYDEITQVESSVDGDELPPPADFAIKTVQLSQVSLELGTSLPPGRKEELSYERDEGVAIAVAVGPLTVKVTVRQNEAEMSPKVEVEGYLGTLHFLLSPHQLGLLQEIAESLVAQAGSGVSEFGRLATGQSRPILHGDRTNIESQLARHHQQELQKARNSRKRQDLLDANPWDNSSTHTAPLKTALPHPLSSDSMYSGSAADHFFSLDLHSSLSSSAVSKGMEDSFASTASSLSSPLDKGVGLWTKGVATVHSRCMDDYGSANAIPLHEGLGLQQLSQPPMPRPPQTKTPPPSCKTPPPSCKFTVALSGMTVALLEADPSYTYTSRAPCVEEGHSGGVAGEASMDETGLDTNRYFELVSELLKDGVNRHQLHLHQEELAQILPADHLMLWLSVVRGSAHVEEEKSWDCEVTLGYGEMWEYLYHNHARINHITKPVSVSPVFQLYGDQSQTPPKPGLKLKVKSSPDFSNKKYRVGCLQTDVEAFLSELHWNFDLTLIDRLQLLLCSASRSEVKGTASLSRSSLDKVKHSLYMTSSNVHTIHQQRQAVFNAAISGPSSPRHRVNVKISGDVIHTSLRFPVPECSQTPRPPWFTASLRTEILFVEVHNWTLTNHLTLAGTTPYKCDFCFSLAQAFLSLDGSVENKELFLTLSKSSSSSTSSVDVVPTISVEVQADVTSSLENPKPIPTQYSQMLDLLEESMSEDVKATPQPFSQRKSMYSACDMAGKGGGGGKEGGKETGHSEELVLPGTVAEMKEFADFASSTARYQICCFFPELKIHLPSKHFLETLYNRLGSDLVLWEPATPTAVSKANAKSVMYSCMDLLQPAATSEDRFLMCKSVLQEELTDDEDDDSSPVDDDVMGGAEGFKGQHLSFLSLSLRVDEAVLSMFPEVVDGSADCASAAGSSGGGAEETELFQSATCDLVQLSPDGRRGSDSTTRDCAVAITEMASVQAFYVSGFQGNPAKDSACVWVQSVALYHHGNLDTADYEKYCSVSKTFDLSVCEQLVAVFGPCPVSPPSPPPPILSLAMEVQLDQAHSTKTSKVAVSVSDAVMFYHLCHPGQGPMDQLVHFLDLQEEAVTDHESPSLVTELHVHLVNSSLEYRPLYLPLVATLVLDFVSLSTSVVSGAPVHVVRVVLDGLHLLLTPSRTSNATPSHHSVCVLDVEWLEVTLRHCNNAMLNQDFPNLFSKMPDVTLECASNAVHIRVCVDSCIALCDLLVYLSSQRDLSPPASPATADTQDYSSLPSTLPSPSPATSAAGSGNLQSDVSDRDSHTNSDGIGDLISDAMEDSTPTNVAKCKVPRNSRPHKIEVKTSGEALFMEFDSDSDSEMARIGKTSPLLLSPPGGGGVRGVASTSIFSDSEDDDFCIVHTPTSTKVAPGAEPKVKCLLSEGEELEVLDDHFSIPDGKMDQLHRPRSFPEPKTQYTLKEMKVIWHMYGGKDFSGEGNTNTAKFPDRDKQLHKRSELRGWRGRKDVWMYGRSWKSGGGMGRDHSVLVEVELDKVRIQHETYPSCCVQSSRLVFLVGDMEVRDRVVDSHINKLLYQYTTEAMPKQSHASMVTLKVLFTQPELHTQQTLEEASVYMSVLPIRLNMDQDTVLFIYEFARHVCTSSQLPSSSPMDPVQCEAKEPSTPGSGRSQPHPLEGGNEPLPQPQCVFIKSLVFQPDLPIRIDYEAKGFKAEIGTVAGILFGLSHLNNSEVNLKTLHYKKGLLGWDKLVEYSTNEWLNDIKSYQLPLLLKGVGPMYNVTQLVYGVMDFVRLPYQQYQEDGRLVWGIQQGTTALTSSTGVAVVELTSQLLEKIQGLAQMAYDMVSPTERVYQPTLAHQQHKPYQPLDFREGFSNAYDVVYAGIGGTAVDLYSVASKEHHERGMAGAVGGVLRHLPGTFVKPIILASEATRHVLGGVKNQFVPDARKEANEKWKSNEQLECSKTP